MSHWDRGIAKNINKQGKLFMLVFASKERIAKVQLSHNTPKTPNVNFWVIWES